MLSSTKIQEASDYRLWLECYAAMVALLSLKYPSKTPHFMAYQHTIIQASRNFEGIAWATYDMCYHRRAANIKSWDWGIIDQDLYSRAFTGRTKQRPQCLAENHTSADCLYNTVGGHLLLTQEGRTYAVCTTKWMAINVVLCRVVLCTSVQGARGSIRWQAAPGVVQERGHRNPLEEGREATDWDCLYLFNGGLWINLV